MGMARNTAPALHLLRVVGASSPSRALRGIGQVMIGRQPGEAGAPIAPRFVS
jgi:hypothetical protein